MRDLSPVRVITLMLLAIVSSSSGFAVPPLETKDSDGTLSIRSGEKPLFVYRYKDVPFKPYVQQLLLPGGFNVLRDNVPDHLHHHGLMYAVAVDGVDFWAETPNCGRQVHKSMELLPANKGDARQSAGFSEQIEWRNPEGAVLLNEQRNVCAHQVAEEGPPFSFLTWESRLSVPAGKDSVELTGSHYFGLGMRFVQSMDAIGTFVNASGNPGEIVRGEERNVSAAWCAYTAAPDGRPVTVAAFGHPDNVRGSTVWFTMAKGFAYMSATLNLHKEPLKIAADKPLVLRYAVALWDGSIEKPQIDKLYQAWLAWPK